MAGNHVLLETISLTQNASSVVFDNIPQTGYTDLKIIVSARSTRASYGDNIGVRFNGDTGNSYSYRRIYALGTGTPGSSNETGISLFIGGTITGADATSNTFSNAEIYIPNYTSNVAKSISNEGASENNATNAEIDLFAGLWNPSTQASISSVTLFSSNSGTLVAGSTFSLYGMAATGTTPASAPKATGGNIVTNDGTYWYHAFLTSGNFVPQTNLTCGYLVIAGGGAGGAHNAGGGGAGGLRSTVGSTGGGGSLESSIAVTSGTNYPITVGAGGVGASNSRGGSGSSSTFSTITSVGGAGGGGNNGGRAPLTGGSGGGGATADYGNNVGSAGTTNQGYSGGGGASNSGGGGGGAGAAGNAASGANGGNGGVGVSLSAWATPTTTGVSNYYAGGGGGSSYSGSQGSAGSGGATAGSYNGAENAVANTGSGAGARNREPGAAGNGGSGIVIIRYAMV